MLHFLQSALGINSRVSFKIWFQDFRVRELTEVFCSMPEWEHYVLPPETTAEEDFFRRRLNSPAFGNCRGRLFLCGTLPAGALAPIYGRACQSKLMVQKAKACMALLKKQAGASGIKAGFTLRRVAIVKEINNGIVMTSFDGRSFSFRWLFRGAFEHRV